MTRARLARLLVETRSEDVPVAWGAEGDVPLGALRDRVAALAATMRGATPPRFVVACEDALAFAAAVVAAARAGVVAVLPPNRRPGTLAALARGAAGVLVGGSAPAGSGDGAEPLPAPALDASAAPSPHAPRLPAAPLEAEAPWLELFTSGTTGEGKGVPKALGHLEREVEALERSFGARLGPGARVFATAPPQHLYGLLFRVCWPLAAGRPFQSQTLLHAGELVPRMAAAGAFALAATPAHLKRLAGGGRLAPARASCRAVFSSGGPLDPETAEAVAAELGEAPVEVLGSTETGGVAWRRQGRGRAGAPWTPLPGVTVAVEEAEGRLRVRSPFVSVGAPEEGEERSFALGDRAELLPDGRFRLGPRADRVVKIGERRLALHEMESRLRAHAWVEEAACLAIERGGATRVGAAVVPTRAGRDALRERGRRSVGEALAAALAPEFDAGLLPRAFRFPEALPWDERGKLALASLRALFDDAPARPTEPEVLTESVGERAAWQRLRVPEDLAFLEGHFEGFPLVAGVVQLHWAMALAERLLGAAPRPAALEALKFRELLRPGSVCRLEVARDPARPLLRFRLTGEADAEGGADESRVYATGRVRLRAGEPDKGAG